MIHFFQVSNFLPKSFVRYLHMLLLISALCVILFLVFLNLTKIAFVFLKNSFSCIYFTFCFHCICLPSFFGQNIQFFCFKMKAFHVKHLPLENFHNVGRYQYEAFFSFIYRWFSFFFVISLIQGIKFATSKQLIFFWLPLPLPHYLLFLDLLILSENVACNIFFLISLSCFWCVTSMIVKEKMYIWMYSQEK